MKSVIYAVLLLALGGCGNSIGGGVGDGGEGVAAVRPSRVTEADLRAAATDPRLVQFYEARGWRPAWTAEASGKLVAAIGGAPQHALDPDAFLAAAQRAEAPAAREAALSLAALTYADALARGRIDPKRLRADYDLPRPTPELVAGLNRAIEQDDLANWLSGLAPQDEEYRQLASAYAEASRQSASSGRAPIADGATLRPGRADPRLPAIAAALRSGGYLPAPEGQQAPPVSRYGPEMVAAVRSLQEDYGLEPSGLVDADTVVAINQTAFDRVRTLAANLERRRWLKREAPPQTRIDVNTAAAALTFWRDGAIADQRRVVTGQPGNETPQLLSPMFRLVANPTWTVPESIEEEEILPQGEAYLLRNNMVRRDDHIVQLSGPKNSLGLVKFDMQNDQAIYLHDTPAKALFSRNGRHFSHGCVRVQDALGFARMIAEQEGVLDDWDEALATGEESFVRLPREIPVRLLYHTAFVEDGRVRYRPDAYGWDEDLAEALGLGPRPRRTRPAHTRDVGP